MIFVSFLYVVQKCDQEKWKQFRSSLLSSLHMRNRHRERSSRVWLDKRHHSENAFR